MVKKIVILLMLAMSFLTFSNINTETLLADLIFKNTDSTVSLNESLYSVNIGDKKAFIGMSENLLKESFGEPKDVLPSEYGFFWNIYHDDFKNYIQIGVKDKKIVGIYTNSPSFSLNSIGYKSTKEDVLLNFESPIEHIIKGNTKYVLSMPDGQDRGNLIFFKNNMYITVFYDTLKNNSVTSVNIIDYDVEQAFTSLFGEGTHTLQKSFEKMNFYVTNALRVREGLNALSPSTELDKIALMHSCDMVKNNYFDHKDLSGASVDKRARDARIKYSAIGENIAKGAQNSIYMHELLMNSEGHRRNILGNFTRMGTGVCFSSESAPYLTQNFLR